MNTPSSLGICVDDDKGGAGGLGMSSTDEAVGDTSLSLSTASLPVFSFTPFF